MQLSSGTHIPDGLLAANALLSEKPRLGVPSWNPALHQGIGEANCTSAIGLRASQSLNRVQPRYTGKERDSESGLDYFGARYYGSSMGRFMSPDWASNPVTIPFANIYDPQSLNLYSYTGNNPLSRYDPDGHLDCSGGATQDVACAVTTAAKAVWHWLSSGSDSGSSSQTNVTTSQQDNFTPQQMGGNQQSLMPRNASINFGGGAEAGLGAGFAVTGQASLALDFKTGALYTMGTNGGTFPAGVYPNANQSPDPKDWVTSLYAGGGFSGSISNGTEDQMAGQAHTYNLGGRFGPFGAGVSYSYTGTPWKPGVYSVTVAPPFANWGAGAQASHFNTNTSVHDLQTTLW